VRCSVYGLQSFGTLAGRTSFVSVADGGLCGCAFIERLPRSKRTRRKELSIAAVESSTLGGGRGTTDIVARVIASGASIDPRRQFTVEQRWRN